MSEGPSLDLSLRGKGTVAPSLLPGASAWSGPIGLVWAGHVGPGTGHGAPQGAWSLHAGRRGARPSSCPACWEGHGDRPVGQGCRQTHMLTLGVNPLTLPGRAGRVIVTVAAAAASVPAEVHWLSRAVRGPSSLVVGLGQCGHFRSLLLGAWSRAAARLWAAACVCAPGRVGAGFPAAGRLRLLSRAPPSHAENM